MRIDDLLVRAAALEARADALQADVDEATHDISLRTDYHEWLAECLAQLDEDLRDRFRREYEGGAFTPKIRSFLEAPQQRSGLYEMTSPENRLPGLSPWQNPVGSAFVGPLQAQCQLLHEQAQRTPTERIEPALLVAALRRFPRAITSLTNRRRGRVGLEMTDEYDVQDAVEVILRALYDDVRAEEATPSHGAGSAAIDFLIPAARLAVEVKVTRPTLRPRAVVDELATDIERYRRHPDVAVLVAFVYDPRGLIRNREGFEKDLARHGPPLETVVIVAG